MPSSPRVTPQFHEDGLTLAEAVAAGDRAAVVAWHEREHPKLMRVAMAVVRDRRQAAEIVQSAFVRAIACIGTFRGEAPLGAWLARITRRVALNELRRARRASARTTTLEDAGKTATTPELSDPIVRARVRAAVEALPESLRRPLLLADVEGYTHAEIAVRLGITPGASRTRAARARSILRVALASLAQPDDLS
jgi:RNA polymerase sigma-70 factor, ECF subfamily